MCLALKALHVQEERDRLRLEFNELEERVNAKFLFFLSLFFPSMVCGVSKSPGFCLFFYSVCLHQHPLWNPNSPSPNCVCICVYTFVHTYTRGPLLAHQPQVQFCVGVSVVTPSLITLCLFTLVCFMLSHSNSRGKTWLLDAGRSYLLTELWTHVKYLHILYYLYMMLQFGIFVSFLD